MVGVVRRLAGRRSGRGGAAPADARDALSHWRRSPVEGQLMEWGANVTTAAANVTRRRVDRRRATENGAHTAGRGRNIAERRAAGSCIQRQIASGGKYTHLSSIPACVTGVHQLFRLNFVIYFDSVTGVALT